ncbi:MAG: YybH family protein [Rubripirellula sp.]
MAITAACLVQIGLLHAQESATSSEEAKVAVVEVGESTSPRDEDESAIRAAIKSYVDAFNQGDAKALASHWGPQGELVTPGGNTLTGQAQLAEEFKAYFDESPNAKLELAGTSIEFISPSVAVESGIARVLAPEQPPSESEYEAVHVKSGGKWKIDSTREQSVPEPPPSHYDQLQALEWMIGTWVDEDETGAVETTCRWTTNSNFIVRSFKVFVEGRVDFEGTQVIGWDPHSEAIRSWMFDSDGGFGAGRWSGGDGQWSVQMLNVLPDGRRGSSTNIYDLVDANTIQFRAIGRQVDGELLPSIKPIRVVRAQQ